MKLCMITPSYLRWKGDSVSAFLHELNKSLVSFGVEIHVVAPSHPNSLKHEVMDGVFIHRFTFFFKSSFQKLTYGDRMPNNLKKSWFAKLQFIPYVLTSMFFGLWIARKYKVNLINSQWAFPQGFIGWFVSRILRINNVLTVHGASVLLAKRINVVRPLVKFCLKLSDKIIVNSDFTKKETCSLGITPYKIVIIPFGVDLSIFKPVKSIKNKLKIKGSLILTFARLVERKGIDFLIKAFSEIKKTIKDVNLMIIGEVPEEKKLRELSDKLGMSGDIIFEKAVKSKLLPQYYSSCDVFCLPSIIDEEGNTETLGVVLLEAMACGKPVVASNVGGIPFAVGKAGILVNQKEVKSLKKALMSIIKKKSLKNAYSKKSLQYIKSFDSKRIARTYFDLFKTLKR